MKNPLKFVLLLLITTSSWAEAPLKPVMDYLRTTPAWIDGHVSFKGNVRLLEDGSSKLDLNKDQSIRFTLKENQIYLYPQSAMTLRHLGFKINVSEVSWDQHRGFRAKAILPVDITGLSTAYVSRNVSEALEEILGERMRQANMQLYRIRRMPQFGTTILIVREIIKIFSAGNGPGLPPYQGEAGISFYPEADKAFGLFGMRVGVKQHDSFRAGFRFYGSKKGIYPITFSVNSAKGVDINYGSKFKQNARIVLSTMDMDGNGAQLGMHLGASETIATILTAAEEIARASGKPVKRCVECYELAQLSSVRLMVEGHFRTATLRQVESYSSIIKGLNVSPLLLDSFKQKESCRVAGAKCSQQCRLKESGYNNIKSCIQKCEQTVLSCMR